MAMGLWTNDAYDVVELACDYTYVEGTLLRAVRGPPHLPTALRGSKRSRVTLAKDVLMLTRRLRLTLKTCTVPLDFCVSHHERFAYKKVLYGNVSRVNRPKYDVI